MSILGSGDMRGLHVGSLRNTVVTDQGVGEDKDLRGVRRIGERLGITDHTWMGSINFAWLFWLE